MSNERREGGIRDMGILDLRYAKTEEDLSGIESISDVGMVLVPETMMGALGKVPMHDVGAIVPFPQDSKVNCMMGEVTLTAEMLESGDPETTLLIAGQAFLFDEVRSVGYKEIRIVGQLFATRSSQQVITAKISQITGQNFFLPSNPRMVKGEMTIGPEFLELLPEPTPLVIMGHVRFTSDVSRDLLREKIPEIVLMGAIHAPKDLVPMVEFLTKEKMGSIEVE